MFKNKIQVFSEHIFDEESNWIILIGELLQYFSVGGTINKPGETIKLADSGPLAIQQHLSNSLKFTYNYWKINILDRHACPTTSKFCITNNKIRCNNLTIF